MQSELLQAIEGFIKGDPIVLVENLNDNLTNLGRNLQKVNKNEIESLVGYE